jgi:glycine oxidase
MIAGPARAGKARALESQPGLPKIRAIWAGVPAPVPAESIPIEPDLDHASEGSRRMPRGARSPDRPQVAIIGAGAIGLALGWRLAAAGCRVEIYERGRAGQGASWAAAGMLAAGLEAEPGEQRLLALNLASQALWPAFRDQLAAATGRPIGYRTEGTLQVALTRDDAARLRSQQDFQHGLGLQPRWLSGLEAREIEPHLRPGVVAGLLSARDHQVDNRLLVGALKVAFLGAGGRLHEQAAVTAIDLRQGRAQGVVVDEQPRPADVVVLAAGAWSAGLPGAPQALFGLIRPVKGQMLALRMDPAAALLRHVLWAPNVYLVPRADGRLLIGATVEEAGFDDRLTAGGVLALLEAAWRVLPAIENLPIDELWTGFRPGSRDDAPILGPCAIDGLILATGHHRNGILLTPLTADGLAGLILTGRLAEPLPAFTLARFAERQAAAGAGSSLGPAERLQERAAPDEVCS